MTGDDTHAWQLERSMTPHQFQRAIDYLGMSQAGPGRFLGVSERTAYRYASGNAKIPTAAALLLRAMVDLGIKPIVPWRKRANSRRESNCAHCPPVSRARAPWFALGGPRCPT